MLALAETYFDCIKKRVEYFIEFATIQKLLKTSFYRLGDKGRY